MTSYRVAFPAFLGSGRTTRIWTFLLIEIPLTIPMQLMRRATASR
jgi:hypothetical protein